MNDQQGLTFARALRSVLRQDPDIVLVGEIRDLETAGIAVQAALTGQLVLSTLHTNDVPAAVMRLRNMQVDAYKIASVVKGVMAQRLVRKLCTAWGPTGLARSRYAAHPAAACVMAGDIAAGRPSWRSCRWTNRSPG